MTLEEISALELKDNIDMILDRILDYSVLEEGEAAYSLDEDEEIDLYDRIYINKKLVLPPEVRILQEWQEYITDLTDTELARLKAQADAAAEAKLLILKAKEYGDLVIPLCHRMIGKIAGANIVNQLTAAQKDQQRVDYGDLFQALLDYRPGKFRSLLMAATPDGVLVKQDLKDELLQYLSDNGVL
jgi:hypothetical protein